MTMIKKFQVKNRHALLQVINNQTELYKFIVDNYQLENIQIECEDVFTTITIPKNTKTLNNILQTFVLKEEYEYADKTKRLII